MFISTEIPTGIGYAYDKMLRDIRLHYLLAEMLK